MSVSVIVPIYNGGPFLKKCIESILGQTYKEFELILVDDGSTDHSGHICDEFALRDGRIRVIHKENCGLIRARITGLEVAKGENIAFVDADDWVEPFFLEHLIRTREETRADIVISGCISERDGVSDRINNLISPGIYEGIKIDLDLLPKMLCYTEFYQFGILPYMWNKLFCKSILERCYTDMDTSIYDGEDVAIVYPYLLHSKKVCIIEECMYHYRIHENSMTAKKKDGYYENVSRLYIHLNRHFKESKYYDVLLPQLKQYMKRMIWLGLSEEEREKERQYCFPFGKVACGANIILYGAGGVGIRYYQQIKKTNYCNIVSWVDKRYLGLAEHGIPVESPNLIPLKKYDCIVIANANAKIREEIRAYLLGKGVSKEKIVMGES